MKRTQVLKGIAFVVAVVGTVAGIVVLLHLLGNIPREPPIIAKVIRVTSDEYKHSFLYVFQSADKTYEYTERYTGFQRFEVGDTVQFTLHDGHPAYVELVSIRDAR